MRAEPGFVVPRLEPTRTRAIAGLALAALVAACFAVFGFSFEAIVDSLACAVLVAVSVTDSSVGSSRTGSSARRSCSRSSCRRCATPPWSGSSPRSRPEASTSSRLSIYPAGIGMGDVKLAGFMGAWLGAPVVVALFAGSILALLPAIVILALHGSAGAEGGNPVCALSRRRWRDRAVLRGRDPRLVARVGAQARRRCWSLRRRRGQARGSGNADSVQAYGEPCRAVPRAGPIDLARLESACEAALAAVTAAADATEAIDGALERTSRWARRGRRLRFRARARAAVVDRCARLRDDSRRPPARGGRDRPRSEIIRDAARGRHRERSELRGGPARGRVGARDPAPSADGRRRRDQHRDDIAPSGRR